MKTTVFKVTLVSGCISAMFSSLPVAAQSPAAASSKTAILDEVVVTAQKRKETLQEVPVSVTALPPEALDSLNVTNVNTLQNAVPNILILNVGSPNTVTAYIRAVGTANAVFSQDPAIGLYVDDVYLTRSLGANRSFFDVERVEVLRGPQGTLYGSNSPAGAIKVVTVKPDLAAGFEGKLEATLGSYKERDLNVAMNIPLSKDNAAARLVVMSAKHDGYQKNLLDGSEAATNDSLSARLHVLTKLSADWDFLLSLDTTRTKTKPYQGVSYYDAPSAGKLDLFTLPGFNKRDFYSEVSNRYDNLDTDGITANLHGKLGGADFRSITSYRKLDERINQDVDGLTFSGFNAHQILKNSQLTQEFNFGGTSGELSWLAGAYFIREKNDFLWDVDFLAGLGVGLVVPSGNALEAKYTLFDQTKDSWSLFTQESWKVTERATVTAGVRWTSETKDFHVVGYHKTAYDNGGTPPGTPIPGFDIQQKKTWSAPQWRLGFDYKLDRDALLFATAARGFRSGGYNGGARTIAEASGAPFEPEYATTYELGAKTSWMNRTVRLNATLFSTDYTDQQVAFLSTGGSFGTSTINSKISGVELEFIAKPANGLTIFANLGTLNGSTNSSTVLFAPNPKYQTTVGFTYSQPTINNLSWFIGANYFRTAEYDASSQHDPLRRIAGYEQLGARAGLASNDDRWKLELIGTNLTDVYTPLFGFNIPSLRTQVRYPNDPRLLKLKLTFNF